MAKKTLTPQVTAENVGNLDNAQLEATWRRVVDEKKNLVEMESLLRIELAKRAFAYNPDMLPTGKKRVSSTVDPSMDIVATFSVNTKVEQERVPDTLNIIREMQVPEAIVADLFRVKYEPSATGLKTLGKVNPVALQVVENILTRSSGMPQVTVEAAKAKRQ